MKFKVHLQQYVEKLSTIDVEAEDESDAKTKALAMAEQAVWTDGTDSYEVRAWAIKDEAGKTVWES